MAAPPPPPPPPEGADDPDEEDGPDGDNGDGDPEKVHADVPAGMSESEQAEMFNAARNDALRDDWACMKGPPFGNEKLPGIRYGASIEMRPLTVMLPCPCAGGVWSPPHADDGAVMDASGMWHLPTETAGHAVQGLPVPQFSIISAPPRIAPDIHQDDFPWWNKKAKKDLKQHEESLHAGHHATAHNTIGPSKSSLPGLHNKHKHGKLNQASFVTDMLKTYYAGSEPYSIDFGCAQDFHAKPTATPGKRWTDTPAWTAIAVATPCPCALGTYSTFNEPSTQHTPPPPDSTLVSPTLGGLNAQEAAPWQGNTGNYYMEGNVGMAGAALAIVTAALFSIPASLRKAEDTRRPSGGMEARRRRSGTSFL